MHQERYLKESKTSIEQIKLKTTFMVSVGKSPPVFINFNTWFSASGAVNEAY